MIHPYFYYGVEWTMFLIGVKYEYKSFVIALGPIYLEWYW